jgi:hypothetical protein
MNVQWGTFHRVGEPTGLLQEAENGMRSLGYQIYDPFTSNDSTVIGGNGNVIVQATGWDVGDGRSYLVVSAYSADAGLAEDARNRVRDSVRDLYNL